MKPHTRDHSRYANNAVNDTLIYEVRQGQLPKDDTNNMLLRKLFNRVQLMQNSHADHDKNFKDMNKKVDQLSTKVEELSKLIQTILGVTIPKKDVETPKKEVEQAVILRVGVLLLVFDGEDDRSSEGTLSLKVTPDDSVDGIVAKAIDIGIQANVSPRRSTYRWMLIIVQYLEDGTELQGELILKTKKTWATASEKALTQYLRSEKREPGSHGDGQPMLKHTVYDASEKDVRAKAAVWIEATSKQDVP